MKTYGLWYGKEQARAHGFKAKNDKSLLISQAGVVGLNYCFFALKPCAVACSFAHHKTYDIQNLIFNKFPNRPINHYSDGRRKILNYLPVLLQAEL